MSSRAACRRRQPWQKCVALDQEDWARAASSRLCREASAGGCRGTHEVLRRWPCIASAPFFAASAIQLVRQSFHRVLTAHRHGELGRGGDDNCRPSPGIAMHAVRLSTAIVSASACDVRPRRICDTEIAHFEPGEACRQPGLLACYLAARPSSRSCPVRSGAPLTGSPTGGIDRSASSAAPNLAAAPLSPP